MNPRVFREYDIRGVADRDLDDPLVADLGRAVAARVEAGRDRAGAARRARVAVGRDCRLTSPRLAAALIGGLTAGGVDVLDIGVVPTPVLYFAAATEEVDGAVMITGSHNPPEDNGFKLLAGGATLYGDEIAGLRRWIEAARERETETETETEGETETETETEGETETERETERGVVIEKDVMGAYLDRAAAAIELGPRRFKVVIDAGNGAGGPGAVALIERLGFEVIAVHCEMDGTFPHHHPDPTLPENLADLRTAVAEHGAEVGLALDGDADRLGAIDGTGRILWGDQLMILLGRALLAEVPGAGLVGEVKCSQAMFDELAAAGGRVEMWKVGHSLIKARMKETGALLAGEMSGHLFFAHRWLGFDDAIYAGARLCELLSRGTDTLAELADRLPAMVNTPEIRIACADEHKFEVVARVSEVLRARPDVIGVVDVDGVRVRFADGWGLVRASNTQPALVVRCEAVDQPRLSAIRAVIEAAIAGVGP